MSSKLILPSLSQSLTFVSMASKNFGSLDDWFPSLSCYVVWPWHSLPNWTTLMFSVAARSCASISWYTELVWESRTASKLASSSMVIVDFDAINWSWILALSYSDNWPYCFKEFNVWKSCWLGSSDKPASSEESTKLQKCWEWTSNYWANKTREAALDEAITSSPCTASSKQCTNSSERTK